MTNDEIWLYKRGSGGGGTEVIPNPEDEATDELEKIKIGETTYSIPVPSGGGYTLIDGQVVDTGNKWIDGTSPIYAVYLSNGITGAGFKWPTTLGRVIRGIAFRYNAIGMSEWSTVDITSDLGCQNELDGTYRVIFISTVTPGPLLLYLV